jgi:signal transduction histidine kinase
MHRELGVVHRLIRHNLRNDLSVIEGYVTVAKDNCDSPKSLAACNRVLKRSEEIEQYVNKTKQIRHIRDNARHQVAVDLNTEVEATLERLNAPESTRVRTNFETLPPIIVSEAFSGALDELLHNAISHNDSDIIEIEVSTYLSPDKSGYACLEITDNGPGIPAEELQVVEDGYEDQTHHSRGLGLWFVSFATTVAGGSMEIDVASESGTTVTLSQPVSGKLRAMDHSLNFSASQLWA